MADIFGSFSTGFQQGRQIRDDRMKRNALLQAGEAFKGGDYGGAANALFASDPNAAIQMQQYGAGLERQQKADDLASQQRERDKAMAGMKAFAQAAQGLKRIPVEGRFQAAQQIIPELAAGLGADPASILKDLTPEKLTDENLDSFSAMMLDPEAYATTQQKALENQRAETKLGLDERRVAALEARAMQSGERDSGPNWRPATPQEQAAYGTQQPLLIDDRTGNVKPIPGAGGVMASADQRGRLALSLPNVIQSQLDMEAVESGADNPKTPDAERRNVFNDQWGARLAEAIPFDGGTISRAWGGDAYQAYDQSSRTFEASIMPIFSGSAVTESEAQRFTRANLPRMGDTPETLKRKSYNRQRIVNGAAEILGEKPPFPGVPSWKPSKLPIPGATGSANPDIEKILDKYAPK